MVSSIILKTLPRHRGALAPLVLYTVGAVTSQSKETTTTHNDSRFENSNKNRRTAPKPKLNDSHHHRQHANSTSQTKVYDYIIIGYGTAGRSAHDTLKSLDPTASIAIIDPFVPPSSSSNDDRFNQLATHINHQQKTITLTPSSPSSTTTTQQLSYQKSILIATGSLGAPIPPTLVDPSAHPRLLEWKTTRRTPSFPSLPPAAISHVAHQAISQGATVAIMGNGIEALSLASSLYQRIPRRNRRRRRPQIILLSGHSHPLSSHLPSYLTPFFTSRLSSSPHVTVANRTLVRYVASPNDGSVEIHTHRSGDDLDTKRYTADLVVVAPSRDDDRGTGFLPSTNRSSWCRAGELLTCAASDGRLVVNRELYAGGSVYGAGSAVRYPSGDGRMRMRTTTAAAMVEETVVPDSSSRRMGRVAARNMVRKGGWAFEDDVPSVFRWTWDEWGVRVVGVGDCKANYATHGFWWTNVAGKRRRMTRRRMNDGGDGGMEGRSGAGFKPIYGVGMIYYFNEWGRLCGIMSWGLQRRRRRQRQSDDDDDPVIQRMKDLIRTNATVAISSPIANDDANANANETTTIVDDDEDLNINHLMEETKSLVRLSISTNNSDNDIPNVFNDDNNNNNNNNNNNVIEIYNSNNHTSRMARPLYRYTPAKPTSQSQLGYVKTNNSHGLFLTTTTPNDTQPRHPSLVKVYPTDTGSRNTTTTTTSDIIIDRSRRPAKEELLWYRQHEISYNAKERQEREFLDNMKMGRFADGSYVVGGRVVMSRDKMQEEEEEEEEETSQQKR